MDRSWIPLTETGPRVTDEDVVHFVESFDRRDVWKIPAASLSSWAGLSPLDAGASVAP